MIVGFSHFVTLWDYVLWDCVCGYYVLWDSDLDSCHVHQAALRLLFSLPLAGCASRGHMLKATLVVTSDAISFCNVRGGGAVDNNSYEWLLKSKNESE